ncbi:gamma-glutamyltransferase [Planctomycetaceae bacterium SCGC AG-212-F19]|nr:gamma-glutamyltransferase [Planctomycetaceae bacterium SCGC AG-212-F19]
MLKTCLLLALVITLVALATGMVAADRHPSTPYRVGRSVVMAPQGMVATSHPLAAQVGLDILRQGGNATDAAIAVNAALGLVEPMSCGIGGDLFAMVWDAKTQKLHGLNASGRSPYKATRSFFADKGLAEIPTTGPLSWSVPGCVDGWEELRKRFGSMSLEQTLTPTIRYAENGFPVTEVIAGSWHASQAALARQPDAARTYLIDGKAPEAGQVFKNPYLAKSYRELAAKGRDAFYKGRMTEEIVRFSEKEGGLFSLKDFADHTSTWVEPVSTTYRGHQVWEIPPPGQGIAVLQMLNMLEGYDLKKLGPSSADWWHLFVEAKKLAYADRAKFYADPAFAKVPTLELISKPYAAKRRPLIDLTKAQTNAPAGDPKLGMADTVYLCVVDKDRNCVSLIQSNYFGFGSGLVPGELGFALQNRGTLFALDANHLNRLEPHKRPFHTIIPSMVTKDGKPWFVFGVMGGDMQPQGQVEVLVNLIDFGMNVQEAGEAPRLEHLKSATPTGRPGDADGGVVIAEPGIAPEIIADLVKRGHQVMRTKKNGGGYQGILIDPKTNMLLGGSEYRKDGCAVGY